MSMYLKRICQVSLYLSLGKHALTHMIVPDINIRDLEAPSSLTPIHKLGIEVLATSPEDDVQAGLTELHER